MPPCFIVGTRQLRILGFLGRSPNINSAWYWEQRRWRPTGPCYIFPVIRRPGFMIIRPCSSPVSVDFSNQRFSIWAVPWILDLCSSCQTVFVETGCSRWILSSAVPCAAVVVWFIGTIHFNARRYLSLSFGFRQLFLLADDVFPWYVFAVITSETDGLDIHNNVAVLVRDAAAKRSPTVCLLWKFDKSPVLQYFHTNCC